MMDRVYNLLNEVITYVSKYNLIEKCNKVNIIRYLFLSFCLIKLYFYFKKPNIKIIKKELDDFIVLDYIEKKSYDYDNNFRSFFRVLEKIVVPYKGDIVYLRNGKWKNYFGLITKYNESDDTWNIKIHKNLNPETNNYPKRKIIRNRNDFIVDRFLN